MKYPKAKLPPKGSPITCDDCGRKGKRDGGIKRNGKIFVFCEKCVDARRDWLIARMREANAAKDLPGQVLLPFPGSHFLDAFPAGKKWGKP